MAQWLDSSATDRIRSNTGYVKETGVPVRRPRPWDGLTEKEQLEMKEVFILCDADGSGAIDWRELRAGLRGLGFPVSKKEAQDMINDADTNGDGYVDLNEFLHIVERLSRTEVDIGREIMQGFRHFDKENKGFITLDDLINLCREVEEYIPRNELREMFALADTDGDGRIDKSEFIKIMLKTNLFR
eukprot:gene7962-708_t